MIKHGLILLTALFLTAQPAFAGKSVNHSIQASKHASQATVHSVIGAAKLTSGIVAIPFIAAGEVGKGIGTAGESMWDEANTPLPISDETITAGPPPSVSNKRLITEQPASLPEEI